METKPFTNTLICLYFLSVIALTYYNIYLGVNRV